MQSVVGVAMVPEAILEKLEPMHIPKKSPYPRLTTGLLVSNA